MYRFMMSSKIHRATVTGSNLDYEGSIAIDEELIERAGMVLNEKIEIYNVNNGKRWSTYIIKGERNSGTICLNGAGARNVAIGDLIIIVSYVMIDDNEVSNWKPTVIFVNDENKVIKEV